MCTEIHYKNLNIIKRNNISLVGMTGDIVTFVFQENNQSYDLNHDRRNR